MTDDPSRSSRSATLGLTVLRGLAVLFAVSVMGCYVWDAQRRADDRAAERAREIGPARTVPAGNAPVGAVADGNVANGMAGEGSAELQLPLGSPHPAPEYLPSSKFAVIVDDQSLPSSKGMVLPTDLFLSSSKSAVIPQATSPSSKVPVVDGQQFLFSSKSAPLPPELLQKLQNEQQEPENQQEQQGQGEPASERKSER